MAPSLQSFHKLAAETYRSVCEQDFSEKILDSLKEHDETFYELKKEVFRREFLGAQLALLCLSWERICLERAVREEDKQKAMLKAITNSFESPKSLDFAKVFSDYYWGLQPDRDLTLTVALVKKMYDRTEKKYVLKDGKESQKLTQGFKALVDVCEGIRSEFEAAFENFIDPVEKHENESDEEE